ncbi:PLAT domain-containing protein [Aphelenchoides besseyi]|nr:PLAT domain-containing protein [Aphelenchoides besseyi]
MSDPQPTSDSPTSPHPAAPPPSPHTPRNAKENAQKTELQPEKIVVALAQSPIVLTAVEQNDAIKPINSIPLHSISSHSNLSTSMLSSGRISYHVSSDSPSNRDTNIPISPLPMTETPQQTETLQPLLQPTPMDSKSPAMTTASTPTSQRTIEFASYSVVVRTGCAQDAGTYANVFIQLTDSDGNQTDKCRLKCSITHRRKFCRGHSEPLDDRNYSDQRALHSMVEHLKGLWLRLLSFCLSMSTRNWTRKLTLFARSTLEENDNEEQMRDQKVGTQEGRQDHLKVIEK